MTGAVVALVAAVLYSLGGVLQHRAVAAHAGGAFDGSGMARGVRQPTWWVGLGVQVLALLVQLVALGLAPLATVQTLMTTMVVWVLVCAAWLEGVRPGRAEYVGAGLVAVGVVAFVVATRTASAASSVDPAAWGVATAGCLALAALGVLAARALPAGPAAAVLGAGSGLLNVLGAGLAGAAILLGQQDGVSTALASWLPYGAAAVLVASIGGTVMAFAAGPVTAAVPPMIAANPVVGSVLGVVLLGQSWPGGAATLTVVALSLAAMVGGIAVLAGSPLVAERLG